MKINHINRDIFLDDFKDKTLIIHIVNDIGAWGKGFVLALSSKWKNPEIEYRKWHKSGSLKLGEVQYVQIEPNIFVANMCAQKGIGFDKGVAPIRYGALATCLNDISQFVDLNKIKLVCGPKFGAGLAGGNWDKIEQIIKKELTNSGIPVSIYSI